MTNAPRKKKKERLFLHATQQYLAFIRKHASIKSELQTETFARVINREEIS